MDIQDYNELVRLTDEIGKIINQMQDLIPEGTQGYPIIDRVLGIMYAWRELEYFLNLIGRNPSDINNLNRKE